MILEIIERISSTTSRNEKEAILRENKDNKDLRRALELCYNPFINFYQRKIPKYKYKSTQYSLADGLEQITELSSRKYTGNDAIAYLTSVLEYQHPDNAVILTRVILKDMRAGFSDSTTNKIWLNLIPTYPVMLASVFEQKLVDKINFPAYFQLKLDGLRINCIVKNNTVEFRTRNGKLLDLLGYLDKDFLALSEGQDCVFDGELLVTDINGDILPRQSGNGIAVKSQKGTISQDEVKLMKIILWDLIPLEDFYIGKCQDCYPVRWNQLSEKFKITQPKTIELVETTVVNSLEESLKLFNSYLEKGLEGGILKDFRGIWEDKRSKSQIKFKAELDCDLLCVGVVEGTGKDAGKMGALELESSDGKIKVSVGSGFNDQHREEMFTQDMIGKIINIKYNARISSKKSTTDSLFLPVFKGIRTDKDVADLSERIK